MDKWARRNEDGKIVEVIDFDPTDKFHQSIVWEKVSDSTQVDDLNNITPENNIAAKEEELRIEAEIAALQNKTEEE